MDRSVLLIGHFDYWLNDGLMRRHQTSGGGSCFVIKKHGGTWHVAAAVFCRWFENLLVVPLVAMESTVGKQSSSYNIQKLDDRGRPEEQCDGGRPFTYNPCAYVNEIWLKMVVTNCLCENENISTWLGIPITKIYCSKSLRRFVWLATAMYICINFDFKHDERCNTSSPSS